MNYNNKASFNRRRNDINLKKRITLSEYDFFTGGGTETTTDGKTVKETSKTADFTIYYNLAFDSVESIKRQITGKSQAQQNAFWVEHFWKAHLQRKNDEGYQVTNNDKKIISDLIQKVEEIRNYHSHIWHDNSVLEFDDELRKFVEKKYEEAKASLLFEFPHSVENLENLLKKEKYKKAASLFNEVRLGDRRKYYITIEGRIFFLSFFLSTGQMNQFLQQRTGYKRSDLPEFKIKRLLYTYYCNRDGASITKFNHEDRFIDQLDPLLKQNIFKARTAFKLLNYLVDYPDYWGNKDSMPLFDDNNARIKDVEQLKRFIDSKNILPALTFRLIERASTIDLPDENSDEELLKEQEEKYRLGSILFKHQEFPSHTFQINFDSLYRLVLLQILKVDEFNPLAVLTATLKKQVNNREMVYNILVKPPKQRSEEEALYLLSRENQYLRGQNKLTELGIIIFENLEKGNPEKSNDIILLANYIRNKATRWIPILNKSGKSIDEYDPEPIQVYQQDFILGQQRKFRAGNRFLFYSAKFLIDFADSDCYWGMENFQNKLADQKGSIVKVKKYFKASEIPSDGDYRLTMENEHVYVAITKDENAKVNHERFYQFAFGPTAMRYLACFIKENESKYAFRFHEFLILLAEDLKKLKHSSKFTPSDGYVLLENPFISSFLKPQSNDIQSIVKRVRTRIEHIKGEWALALQNRHQLSRSEKNRLVMKAYRLFDWANERKDGKFLRADEYNQMSVCHYSLHLKNKNANSHTNFYYLYDKLFKLRERQPPIPYQVRNILFRAQSLDELMELVFNDREAYLDSLMELPAKFLKRELPSLCRKIGISMPANLLKEEEKSALSEKHQKTLDVLPYAVHPMLVLKFFFPEEYKNGIVTKEVRDKTGKLVKTRASISVFESVRKNTQLNNVLQQEVYSCSVVEKLYPGNAFKKQREKLIGQMNTTFTEDILLWWMAQRYLKNNDYTSVLGKMVLEGKNIKINDLNSLEIPLQLKRGTEKETTDKNKLLDPIENTLYTSVLMHQLDDLMFMTEQHRLRKAAVHFIKRCTTEKEIWSNDLNNLSHKQLKSETLPDGSKENPIPFQILRNELELVKRTGQKLADYILRFEKDILQKHLNQKFGNDKEKYQDYLIKEFYKQLETKGEDVRTSLYKAHINFDSILKLANIEQEDIFDLISTYRNIAFHNDVPIVKQGSFTWLTKEGSTIRNILMIEENLNVTKDRTIYLI